MTVDATVYLPDGALRSFTFAGGPTELIALLHAQWSALSAIHAGTLTIHFGPDGSLQLERRDTLARYKPRRAC